MPRLLMNTKKTLRNTSPHKVFVGLSGGVDSAVSAAILKDLGYDVTGVFIKVWQPDFLPCSWRDERRDAMKVAIALNMPFLFFDFEEEYKKGVVDKMIAEYKAGRTPNPDVLCNREIKFGAFWKKAKELGANYIATGHYARIEDRKLKEGKDKEKDQSYFLWTLTQDNLSHTIFPVGNLNKSEVRKLARRYHLPVSEKKDSQGICFIGDISMNEFLTHFISTKSGDVLNTKGKTIGTHKGALFYTIGERHGFEITKKQPEDGAFYILSKDMKANTITVSNKEPEIISFSPTKITVKSINWITEATPPLSCSARIRYRGEKIPIIIKHQTSDTVMVEFKEPVRGLSLGQSIVFYDGDVCLGGGVMTEVLH
jgi:tRNA-uridine 2-sulfurtransferase